MTAVWRLVSDTILNVDLASVGNFKVWYARMDDKSKRSHLRLALT